MFALFLLQGFVFQWDIVSSSRLNLNPMEEGQYGQHVAGDKPSAYRSMRDYRNQWMSSPYGSTYNHSWGNHTNSSWELRPTVARIKTYCGSRRNLGYKFC